jgi:hypothetical protein
VDRDAIARRRRRSQALEVLEFERERERALADQLESIVAEEEGRRVDEEAFARMAPEDVAIVRELLGDGWEFEEDEEEDELGGDVGFLLDDEDGELEEEEGADEVARLQGLLESCRTSQRALERFIEALGP